MSDINEEILNDTLEYLEGIDETRNIKILTTIETNILLDYITNLKQENNRLNNIIDELEKWLKEDLKQQYRDCGHRNNIIREVYNKLNELKGDNK